MTAFPSPASGHEEPFIGDSLHEHIIRKPSATLVWMFDYDFVRMNLRKGDIAAFEVDRRPHDECFAVTDEIRGRVTENMLLVGGSLFH